MQSPLFVGIDVAKDELVVACSQQSFTAHAVPNTQPALRKFLLTLPVHSCIAMEATGIYHQQAADLAHKLKLRVYVIHPQDMRHYAQGVGRRAKTDRIDAQVIARFLAHEIAHLRPYEPPTLQQRTMDQLLKRRAKIVSLKTALKLSCAQVPSLKKDTASLLVGFDTLLDKIDQQIAHLNDAIPQRAAQVKRLQTITGVGALTSAWLANLLDRVKFTHSDALVAFTGMDPRPNDSGHKRGKRRLSKRGPAEGRRLLFNVGMAAAKSKVWAAVYAHYRQLGWSSTATILIIARKILRIAFALHKTQMPFDPKMLKVGA